VNRRASYIPRRGDLVWLTFDPQTGHEQRGRRPAVVLSPIAYNQKSSLAICCPITSRVKGYPFEVGVAVVGGVSGVILADQVKSLDWRARRAEFVGRISDKAMIELTAKLAALLGA
jgi:mRNA interferase MazF